MIIKPDYSDGHRFDGFESVQRRAAAAAAVGKVKRR